MHVQIFNVLPPKQEVGMHHIIGGHVGGSSCGVKELPAFGSERFDILEGNLGVGLVDGIESALVSDVVLGD